MNPVFMKRPNPKSRSNNIHKSRVPTARKPVSLCAPDSLIRELVQLNAKNCRGKLPADGKERLKVLQDRYSAIQAHRKRSGLELMPEVEDLFVEQMIREPVEAYPFEFSDDDLLPTLEGLEELERLGEGEVEVELEVGVGELETLGGAESTNELEGAESTEELEGAENTNELESFQIATLSKEDRELADFYAAIEQ